MRKYVADPNEITSDQTLLPEVPKLTGFSQKVLIDHDHVRSPYTEGNHQICLRFEYSRFYLF